MPCHWITDRQIGRVFIPECMGGAHNGMEGCTCRQTTPSQELEARVQQLERDLAALRRQVARALQPPPPPATHIVSGGH